MLVFAWPDITALTLLYVIGAYAFAFGCCSSARRPASAGPSRHGLDDPEGRRRDRLRDRDLRGPGAGALAVLGLIAAFALVTGISELVVSIAGEKLLSGS